MYDSKYDGKCAGCRLAHRLDTMTGGFIPLGEYWMVNHNGGSEAFLGWLVMQPRQHRTKLSEFTDEELREFGIQTQRLEKALCETWSKVQPNDPIKRVYVALFSESALQKDAYWHIHFHVVPRTKSIGEEQPAPEEQKLAIKDHKGWYIVRQATYPRKPHDEDIKRLMNMLRNHLDN